MDKILGRKILRYTELDSTNDELKRLVQQGAEVGTTVIAKKQSAGKGRQGRLWDSSEGGLFMSVLLGLPSKEQAPQITLVTALAVNRALRNIGIDSYIKWPNDILLNGKKICGILAEAVQGANNIYNANIIMGIGLNVNNREFKQELQNKASSLLLESNRNIYDVSDVYEIEEIAEQLLCELDKLYIKFCEADGFADFRGEYKKFCINLDKEIRFFRNTEQKATAIDISQTGGLVVRDVNGIQQALHSGEVFISIWDY